MHWTFDWGWCLGGIAVLVAGALIVKFHQAIANNLASGVASYDKVKLFGILACVLGVVFISNMHSVILYFIFHLIMPNQFP
ncbi:hypothetical protein IKQ38_05260 [Candidatus Saccharibacteria bacterium]|jgi:hypothetical protein|nr:hypothetical protein [Candidatus Saccharibacteria bacterium]MCQ2568668.1 hypothetical protein [Candidatus Saccharibacteria bacterium]